MKKWFIMSLGVLVMLGTSCKDDNIDGSGGDNPADYEARLEGTWDLTKVHYDTEIPDLGQGSSTPITGDGTNVNGNITLTRNPNEFTYDFSFSADLNGIPVPVNQQGSGTWTTSRDNTKLIVTDENGEETVFLVVTNEPNKQVYTTTIIESFQSILTLEIDLELEFEKP